MLDNLINILNDSSNIEPPAMSSQINMLSNDIFGSEDNANNIKGEKNLSKNRSQGHHQRNDLFIFFLGAKKSDGMIWGEKDNKGKKGHHKGRKKAIRRRWKIFEINIYYHMIYR